ncbi:MAG: hypothetical protein Q9216_001784 [Gyalolechia sp. 2 TL-2023]
MPQLSGTGKTKSRDGRCSRSRNTTPISSISIPISSNTPSHTAYLNIDLGSIMVPANVTYEHLLNQHGGAQGIPDPASLNQMVDNLKMLGQLAEERGRTCDGGMRELSKRRKERVEDDHRLERENREREEKEREKEKQKEKEKEKEEEEEKEKEKEKVSLKRAAEDEEARGRKSLKTKKAKKERSSVREERPLAVGAHGLARQDGVGLSPPDPAETTKNNASSPKRKLDAISSSSLSSTSQPPSPTTGRLTEEPKSPRKSRASSTSSIESHQPPPAASIAQYQTFGPDPTTFDDPTIYHIREVTGDMTDQEKAEVFSVTQFPRSDLSHLIAGTIPDKDFSNAKPSNQVNANTFQAYIDPYLRPLTEEDMAFLKERGDRVAPFVMPRRGKRHYTEIWAEEDGQFSLDSNQHDKDILPPNQPRGNLEQMTDEIAETDQISNGPLLNRLLSTMRFENRISPSDDTKPNGNPTINGDVPMSNGLPNGDNANGTTENHDEPSSQQPGSKPPSSSLQPATYMPESSLPSWRQSAANSSIKMDAATIDDRLKQELRYIGFLAADNSEPDYDAHYDDEVAERLRMLQEELRRVSLENGARKARILELANERMAYQEYSTILDDLDGQVQQAYLKRTRTLGKSKKNIKRPGGAGGGSHPVHINGAGGDAVGISKPGIGDLARQLMARRQKWVDMISPVFDGEVGGGLQFDGKGTVFEEVIMERLMKAERDRWEEETE